PQRGEALGVCASGRDGRGAGDRGGDGLRRQPGVRARGEEVTDLCGRVRVLQLVQAHQRRPGPPTGNSRPNRQPTGGALVSIAAMSATYCGQRVAFDRAVSRCGNRTAPATRKCREESTASELTEPTVTKAIPGFPHLSVGTDGCHTTPWSSTTANHQRASIPLTHFSPPDRSGADGALNAAAKTPTPVSATSASCTVDCPIPG